VHASPPGAPALALRRGAEGGRPGDAGEEFGVDVDFRGSTTICIERPVGTGEPVELIGKEPNPFLATVGLRVEPAPIGSGVDFRLAVELGSMPFAFIKTVEDTVRDTRGQGLRGREADAVGSVLPVLGRLPAVPGTPQVRGSSYLVEGDIPAAGARAAEAAARADPRRGRARPLPAGRWPDPGAGAVGPRSAPPQGGPVASHPAR
jgi:hypothetical protein